MAGGPIFPYSMYLGGASGRLFPNFDAGSGVNISSHEEGIGVMASVSASASTAELRYLIPPSLPTGTMKLLLTGLANATTGGGVITVWAAAVNAGSSASNATLTSQACVLANWTSANVYVTNKVTFAVAPLANQYLNVALSFQSGGGPNNELWTLAQVSTWQPALIWE